MNKKILLSALASQIAILASAVEFKIERNITYHSEATLAREGEYARNRCLLDVRWPVGATNFATVVNLHGGGLVKGNKSEPAWPQEARNSDTVAFVSVGYRLLTNAVPEQTVGDAAAAVAWTLKNISRYGGDPKKVFVTGISGGGYLTAMIGMDYKWLAPHGFKPTDLCGIAPLTGQMTKHFNIRKIGFKDSDPQFTPKVDEWAPLFHASSNALPATCFLTGGRDIEWKARVEENALLAASIKANNHPNCEFHETEGNHGGGVYPCRYLLRDFVMKTCDTGGVARFADGERVAFFGDSIIHGGYFHIYLQLFWSTRYPGSNVYILNCGLGGNTAAGGIGRVKAELLPLKPNRVFMMYGMNDVGRKLYQTQAASGNEENERQARYDLYVKSMRKIVGMLAEQKIKTVLMTPSPYDQYSPVQKKESWMAVNDPGLTRFAAFTRELAKEHNLGLVEFHTPMTEIFKSSVDKPLCADRVHPGREGHILMMALILDSMHLNPYVARVAIDAEKGVVYLPSSRRHKDASGKKLPDCFNVTVSAVEVREDGVAFTYAPKAMPFPATAAYRAAERLYPLTERLNQEIFMIENLKPGRYELAFDGMKVGEFSAEELNKGVNVALLDTPNQRKAAAVVEYAENLRRKYSAWRRCRGAEKVAAMGEMDDVRERLNALRPEVSRVTVKLIKE